jgi:hypothetical protein
MSCTQPLHFPQCYHIWYDSHVIVFGTSLYRFTYQDAYFYMTDRSNTYLLHGEFSLLLRWFSQLETSICQGFSMAMLNNQRVTDITRTRLLYNQLASSGISPIWVSSLLGTEEKETMVVNTVGIRVLQFFISMWHCLSLSLKITRDILSSVTDHTYEGLYLRGT